jgi:perosamine synthetase
VNIPVLGAPEAARLQECIDTGWISSEGPFVAQFEEAFAKRIGRRYGVAVSNGSAALELALAALGLPPGAEVIIPTFTIISCAAAVIRAGAIPVAVDCDPLTWNATPETVAAAISSQTKAIMIVHIYGLPVDMDGMIELAERHGLAIVEDASEGLGQSCRGRPCGGFGALSTFSFYPNKLVTTGEGGMIVTDDPATAGKLRSMRNLCHDPNRRFLHHDLGWNHRMTNLQAAVGLAQLDRLEHFTARKRRIGALYAHLLAGNPYTQLPLPRTSYAENLYWVFGIVLHDEAPVPPSELATKLAVRGIGTRPFFWPMHEQPVLRRMGLFNDTRCPVAERIGRRGLYLPSGLGTSDEQIERVADAVGELLG